MTAAWAGTHTHMHMLVNLHTHTQAHLANSKLHKFISSSFVRPSSLPAPCPSSPSTCGPLLPLHATPTCLQAICKIDYAHKLKQTSDDIKMLLLPQGLLVTGHIHIHSPKGGVAGEAGAGGGRGNTCLCLCLCFFRLVLRQIEFHSLFTYLNLRNQIQFALIVLPVGALSRSDTLYPLALSLSLPYSLPSILVICQLTTAKCCN